MKVTNKYKRSIWDAYYSGEDKIHIKPKNGFFISYDVYLCDSLVQRYMPRFQNANAKICEIGSGDGKLLKKFSLMLGCKPYGVEYSKEAAKWAIKDVKTIITDAFDESFLKKYKNYFDIVFSYGFIEHIMPSQKAAKIHFRLLKPGGYVIIQIPRFKGFNLLKAKLLRPELIPLHNLNIMNEDVLREVCQSPDIKELYCKNYGTFKLRFPMDKKNLRFYLLKTVCYLEYIINPLLRILFGDRGFETNLFSPAVIFIGRKKISKKLLK